MTTTLRIFQGQSFLGGRGTACKARNMALAFLREGPNTSVAVDFEDVIGVSHSFADELMAPLSEELGKALSQRVTFRNCCAEVVEAFVLVCEMHGLFLPKFDEKSSDMSFAIAM